MHFSVGDLLDMVGRQIMPVLCQPLVKEWPVQSDVWFIDDAARECTSRFYPLFAVRYDALLDCHKDLPENQEDAQIAASGRDLPTYAMWPGF